MKYLTLVWSALFRRKTRTILTLISIIAAFLLFGMLDSVRTAFVDIGRSVDGASQLITMSKLGLGGEVPLSIESRIASVPGVLAVTRVNWLGGIYRNPKNFFPSEAVGANFFQLQDGMVLPPDQLKDFQTIRNGAVVGKGLVERFGWKIGDKIPLQATNWPKKDGSDIWTFTLVGIFHAKDEKKKMGEGALFFRWQYFDEARQFGNGSVGWYEDKIASPAQASRVSAAIDAISANSDHETRTESANAFGASLVSQVANIGMMVTGIMAAVFFTLMLLTGNTMAQAVRERIPEIGVLKTVGFTNCGVLSLVLAESMLLVVIGGVIGMVLATVVVAGLKVALVETFPMAQVGGSIWCSAIVLMTVISLVVGVLPALRGMRLKIVDALAGR